MDGDESHVRWLVTVALVSAACVLADETEVALYGTVSASPFLSALDELGVVARVAPIAKLREGLVGCDGVIVVAGQYPRALAMGDGEWRAISGYLARGTNVYVEYAYVPGWTVGKPTQSGYDRIQVPEEAARTNLPALTILEEHQSHRLTLTLPEGAEVWLTYARVAGLDRAVFGPPKQQFPALVSTPRGKGTFIYATTALSNATRGRYKPSQAWRTLMRQVVLQLLPEAQRERAAKRFLGLRAWTEPRDWVPPGSGCKLMVEAAPGSAVSAQIDGAGSIGLDHEVAGRWTSSPLQLDPGAYIVEVTARKGGRERKVRVPLSVERRAGRYRAALGHNVRWFERADMLAASDGSRGVCEGLRSSIRPNGSQSRAAGIRVDCVSECALMFYLYGKLTQNEEWQGTGRRMMDYTATKFQVTSKDTYYFGDWQSRGEYDPAGPTYVFNDDSGAATAMCFAFYHFTSDTRYLEPALRGAKYFQRVTSAETGLLGGVRHRGWRGSSLVGVPWEKLRKRRVTRPDPHQMSWPQTALLYAYATTGDGAYLDLAEKGIRSIMRARPKWHITTSRSCEYVRMLLPLALLYRYRPSPEVTQWLDTVIGFIGSRQQPCGAIQEWDGRAPATNERFGTGETSVFQRNGDPVSDQLYNTGFALLHLWVAYKATGETRLLKMFEQLGDYLTRIQIRSDDPQLDGTWMRAFDYHRWEYFGSSADVGWGPYCVETGWSCAPLDLGLIMYLADLDPAPARPGGSAEITALSKHLDAEFEQVRHLLSLPPPAKVTGLRTTPTRGNYVELLWDKPADGHAACYKVYRSRAPQVERTEQALAAATQEEDCLLPDLEPDQEYFFQVIAENAQGQTSAPSPTLRVHTGPVSLARGTPYTKSSQPTSYPDAGERESTDGVYAGPYRDGRSYGYRLLPAGSAIDLDIVVDLGAIRQIGRASHQACGAAGYKPDRLDLHTSTDGKTSTLQGSATVHRSGLLVVDFTPTPTRYVRFHFHKQRRGATDDWLFVGELEVF